jgi:hypothetical protein
VTGLCCGVIGRLMLSLGAGLSESPLLHFFSVTDGSVCSTKISLVLESELLTPNFVNTEENVIFMCVCCVQKTCENMCTKNV